MGLVLQCVRGSRSKQIDFWPSPYCERSSVSEADGLWEIFIHIDRGGWWVCYEHSSSNSLDPSNVSKYQSAIGGKGARMQTSVWMPRKLNEHRTVLDFCGGDFHATGASDCTLCEKTEHAFTETHFGEAVTEVSLERWRREGIRKSMRGENEEERVELLRWNVFLSWRHGAWGLTDCKHAMKSGEGHW